MGSKAGNNLRHSACTVQQGDVYVLVRRARFTKLLGAKQTGSPWRIGTHAADRMYWCVQQASGFHCCHSLSIRHVQFVQ